MSILKAHIKKYAVQILLLPVWRLLDLLIPKRKNYWAFSVHHIKSDLFIENQRAVFEEVKTNTAITKFIFVRNAVNDFHIEDAINVEYVNIKTLSGLWLFLRCKVIFVSHSVSMDYSLRWGEQLFSVVKPSFKRHIVVNVWHGIPLKKLYALWNPSVKKRLDRVKFRHYERKNYTGLIASSLVDSYAMATMFYPINYSHIWLTGLPRNDFLLKNSNELPAYLTSELQKIKRIKGDKKLICYAPTYRQTAAVGDSTYYQFTQENVSALKMLLRRHNAVLGFRMHYFRNNKSLFNLEDYIDNDCFFDLGHGAVSEIAAVIRETDLMITDYSSVFIDSIYVNKPVFSFAYDLEHYKEKQDGLLYDMDMVFPGPVVRDFNSLLAALDAELTSPTQIASTSYSFARKFFFDFIDTDNSARVVNRIKSLQ